MNTIESDIKKAFLSNEGRYTIFRYGDERLKIIAPYSLEYYYEVKEWDKGYIVVSTKYKHSDELVEEYIDLIPVFDDLMLDKAVLEKIKEVEVFCDGNFYNIQS